MVDPAVVADLAKLVVQPSALAGKPYLEGVVDEAGESDLDKHHHLQRAAEALEHPWCRWPENHWEVLEAH